MATSLRTVAELELEAFIIFGWAIFKIMIVEFDLFDQSWFRHCLRAKEAHQKVALV